MMRDVARRLTPGGRNSLPKNASAASGGRNSLPKNASAASGGRNSYISLLNFTPYKYKLNCLYE